MPHHIFYSWQSDAGDRIGHRFIKWALDRTIHAHADLNPADGDVQAGRDNANVLGMPRSLTPFLRRSTGPC